MAAPVAIIGVYQTAHQAAKGNQTLEEIIFQSVHSLLDECGMTLNDIDGVVSAGSDQTDGRAISMMHTSGPVGAEMKDLITLSGACEQALILAYYRVLSGVFQTSLVVNWGKPSESQVPQVENLSRDPFFERDFGMDSITACAIHASAYLAKYKTAPETVASVVEKNRANAVNNPLAHLRKKVNVDEVLRSRMLSWPIRELEAPPHSDGACVLILASEEKARKLCGKCAWIKGVGSATDTYWKGDTDLTAMPSLEIAARKAYAMAGIKTPLEDIDVAEVHDISAYHELMAYEALGFCGRGEAGALIAKGVTARKGILPVNPSGGALSSNPATATGLVRVCEAALQVMGSAGERQVEGAQTALAHASSGYAGQGNSVFILGREAHS